MKETSSQVFESDTESLLKDQTRSIPVQCPNDSKKQQNEIQRNEIDMTTYDNGDDNISPPEITTSQIEERLVRDDITNELYMPLSCTIVLKGKKKMLHVPLDFDNGLTIDALVVSGAYVSAVAQKELDRIKQQAPSNILKVDEPPNFQIQVANGQLEKPIATATLKFDIGDHTFAEHFVVMKNLTGPIIGLHFMRHNTGVIDTTHGLIHFLHLTMQVKSALSQTSAKTPNCSHPWQHNKTTNGNKNIYSIYWPLIGTEYNRDRDSTGKIHKSRKFDNIPFNVNNIWHKNSSQSNQKNGITFYNQQKHTICRIIRSHSGAIQVY